MGVISLVIETDTDRFVCFNAKEIAAVPNKRLRLHRPLRRLGPDLIDPGVLECMTLASAVAASTRRIRVGLGVVNLMLRSPALLLRSLASLDQLSNGRLTVGIGVGVDFNFDQSV